MRLEHEVEEGGRRVDCQLCVVPRWLVCGGVGVAHLVSQACQSVDDTREARRDLTQELGRLDSWIEMEQDLSPSIQLGQVAIVLTSAPIHGTLKL